MNEPTALCYSIREPFKFRGVTVKPPAFVQMERDEARKYIDAGVIGDEDEACLVPDDAERLEAERKAAADAAKGAGEEGKTAKDGDTKTTAAGAPATGGRGARKAGR